MRLRPIDGTDHTIHEARQMRRDLPELGRSDRLLRPRTRRGISRT
jgi:hypothetical protein